VPLACWFGGDFDRFAAGRLDAEALSRRPELGPAAVEAFRRRASDGGGGRRSLRLPWATLLYVMRAEPLLDRAPRAPGARPRLESRARVA
jgi:hypothetical protein